MNNKNIGLDLDGVLYPFTRVVYDRMVKHYSETMSYTDFWYYARQKNYMQKIIKMFVNTPEIYLEGNISNINKEVLSILVNQGNELFYITARPKFLMEVTKLWMMENNLPYRKNLMVGQSKKSRAIQDFECDIFVDDREHVIQEIRDKTFAVRYLSDYLREGEKEKYLYPYPCIHSLSEIVTLKTVGTHFQGPYHGEEGHYL